MMGDEELDSREKSDVLLKLAVKGATKAAKYVLEKVLLSTGIPKGVAGPISGYYSEHVRLMVHLVDIQLRTNGHWEMLTGLRHELDKYVDQLGEVLNETPLPPAYNLSPAAFSLLLFPGVGEEIQNEIAHYREEIITVVAGLDGPIHDGEKLFEKILLGLQTVNEKILSPKGNLEWATGTGGLMTARTDLGYSEIRFEKAFRDLVNHRNDWARRIGLTEVYPRVNLSQIGDELSRR